MEKAGFLEKKDGKNSMGEALSVQIGARKKERERRVLEGSMALLLAPMFKFYLTTPREQRKKSNLYPGMAVVPTSSQARLFTFLYEADNELPAPSILRKKIEIEEMGLRVDSRKLAAALLLRESGKSEGWVAEFLGMEVGEVKGSRMMLESVEKEGRGGDFLKRIKKD
jgi:hypothetical protein